MDFDSDLISPQIQWYPGHIAKYERQLGALLKLVDVVVEVLDSRIPQASVNLRLERQIRDKPTVIVLNKSDLADPAQNAAWLHRLTFGHQQAILYNAKNGQGKNRLIQSVLLLGEPVMQKLISRGRLRRPVRVLVAGMPNVGKSTLINSLVARKKAKTGHRAGVTRVTQWIRVHPSVELLDSPGVIPPQLDDAERGKLLATVSAIGDAAFEEIAIARFLLKAMHSLYPDVLRPYFKLSPEQAVSLEEIAVARHYKLSGDQPDVLRTAQATLREFRQARIGRMTLEHVSSAPRLEAPLPENDRTEPAGDASAF